MLLSTEDISSIVRDRSNELRDFRLEDLNDPVNLVSREEMLATRQKQTVKMASSRGRTICQALLQNVRKVTRSGTFAHHVTPAERNMLLSTP